EEAEHDADGHTDQDLGVELHALLLGRRAARAAGGRAGVFCHSPVSFQRARVCDRKRYRPSASSMARASARSTSPPRALVSRKTAGSTAERLSTSATS